MKNSCKALEQADDKGSAEVATLGVEVVLPAQCQWQGRPVVWNFLQTLFTDELRQVGTASPEVV